MFQSEEQKEKRMKKNEQNLGDLWDTIKCTNLFTLEILKGEARKNGTRRPCEEIATEKVSNLIKFINLHIQKVQQTPRRINSKIHTYNNQIIESKGKETTLKAASKREVTHHVTAHFLSEIMEVSRPACVLRKKSLPNESSQNFPPMFSSRSFFSTNFTV